MAKKSHTNFEAALFALSLDAEVPQPMHQQLTEALRDLALRGVAPSGARLPATRNLAQELSVSRSTIITAFEQLIAEGVLETRPGAGTYIARDLPHLKTPVPAGPMGTQQRPPSGPRPFAANIPDPAIFPHARWAHYLDLCWRKPAHALMNHRDTFGWPDLRQAIADHLLAWRGYACSPEQIVITAGSADAFDLIALLLDPHRPVYAESPGYHMMIDRLERLGLQCRLTPVDDSGLDPAKLGNDASAVIVTPSRQFPLGMTMPLPRRLDLLAWASKTDAFVIEDDYDSEFRFRGQPVPALASIDRDDRTIYIGSFSKLLSPALRLGYVILPRQMTDTMRDRLRHFRPQASLVPQPALARFMQSGEFAIHLRRMRRIYAKRYHTLLKALDTELGGFLNPQDHATGMHIFCQLGPKLRGVSDKQIVQVAAAAEISLLALSDYPQAPPIRQGIIMGFAAHDETALIDTAKRLRVALNASGL